MTVQERIETLAALGEYIGRMEGRLEFVIRQAFVDNPWFTVENIKAALSAIQTEYLNKEKLTAWAAHYALKDDVTARKVGLVLAGNIPLVGFQDLMNVFAAGHQSLIKLSDKDKYLIPHLIKVMTEINPDSAASFEIVSRLSGYEAVIATGSNNTARYFEAYFGKQPNIIRRNRNSVAVLNGSETDEEFRAFNRDVFQYFGLGCRNVAKIYVPKGYDFNQMLEIMHEQNHLANHNKYKNNFEYNLAFNILNRTPYYNNGAVILVEAENIASRIAQLNYETYENIDSVYEKLKAQADAIQCIVANNKVKDLDVIPFGSTQTPSLMDYADGVDTMEFLTALA